MSKPIEVGCLALIIRDNHHPELIGKMCTAIKKTDRENFIDAFNDQEIGETAWDIEIDGDCDTWFAYEEDLLRIDDYDASADEVEQERELSDA